MNNTEYVTISDEEESPSPHLTWYEEWVKNASDNDKDVEKSPKSKVRCKINKLNC